MKVYHEFPSFPLLRRHYSSYKAVGDLIGRSTSYVNNCLNGRRDFTRPEKYMIAGDMNMTVDEVFGRPEVM